MDGILSVFRHQLFGREVSSRSMKTSPSSPTSMLNIEGIPGLS